MSLGASDMTTVVVCGLRGGSEGRNGYQWNQRLLLESPAVVGGPSVPMRLDSPQDRPR